MVKAADNADAGGAAGGCAWTMLAVLAARCCRRRWQRVTGEKRQEAAHVRTATGGSRRCAEVA